MKKLLVGILLIGTLVGSKDYYGNHYQTTCEVSRVYVKDSVRAKDRVILADEMGDEWQVYATNLKKGDKIVVKWYTNHSLTRFDDEIIGYKKIQ